jgi:hypothetical protein
MLIDSNRITDFRIVKKKDVTFNINGKEVTFVVPYIVSVNPEFKRIYTGEMFESSVDLVDEDVEAILNGDESAIESACEKYVWEKIARTGLCKK